MIRIEISETTAAVLSAQAAAQGLTVEAYLERVLRCAPGRPTQGLSPDDLSRLLDEEATAGHSPTGSFSRTELYRDHD